MDAEQLYAENVMLKERSRQYRERCLALTEQMKEARATIEALKEDVGLARRERNEMMTQHNLRLAQLHVAQREVAHVRRNSDALKTVNKHLMEEISRLNRQLEGNET